METKMTPYTTEDISKGAGAFEQAMRAQIDIPGTMVRMTPQSAVGILSAAMRSGLPVSHMEQMIERHFASEAQLLKRILARYEGSDWDIDLWNALPNGRYKLCTDLCRSQLTAWRYSRNTNTPDL